MQDLWSLSQIPNVSGAFVAIDPQNGSVLALVGGFDYNYTKFNRVTQAKRQPGSSFNLLYIRLHWNRVIHPQVSLTMRQLYLKMLP